MPDVLWRLGSSCVLGEGVMSIVSRLSNLFSRAKMEREIDTELQTHIDFRIEDNLAAGMSAEEARREALLRFGNPVLMRERVSGEDASLNLDGVWRDACYAFRQLRRSPRFAVTSIVVLPPGIWPAPALFSAV